MLYRIWVEGSLRVYLGCAEANTFENSMEGKMNRYNPRTDINEKIALAFIKNSKKPVLFFSLELDTKRIEERLEKLFGPKDGK